MARDANGRQLGFHPGVSGFDPRTRYQIWTISSAVEHHVDIVRATGSIPVSSTTWCFTTWPHLLLVKLLVFQAGKLGSIPSGVTK